MRRTLTALAATLALLAIAAPAHAATQLRHFHDPDVSPQGPSGQDGGELRFDVVFKDKPGPPRKFTPRRITSITFTATPLRCPPNQAALLTTTLTTNIKLRATPRPGAKPNRYSFSFSAPLPGMTATFSGKIFKRDGRGPVLANGKFVIADYDFPAPGPSDCFTDGPRGWSAR
jgi:hypothetical protein